jgi:8-oxo-dGDP phosphatase
VATQGDGASGFVSLDSEVLWQGRRVAMRRGRFLTPDGEAFDREYMDHPGAVGVIAVDDDGVVTLVRQFRGPMARTVLEMPAGTRDVAGEPALETGRRELAEEVGLRASRWEELAALPVSPGVSDQITTVFLATGLSECPLEREGPEERAMTIERVSIDEVTSMVAAGELMDAVTVAGIALARAALARRG